MQGLPAIKTPPRRSGNFAIMSLNVLNQPRKRQAISRISNSFNPYAVKISFNALMSKRHSTPTNTPPPQPTLKKRSDSLINLFQTTNIKNSEMSIGNTNTFNGKKYFIIDVPHFDTPEFTRKSSFLIGYLEEESKVFIPIVCSNKTNIVYQFKKFIEICDKNSFTILQTMTLLVRAIQSNLFPTPVPHFAEFTNFDALIPDPNPNWFVLNPMYKLLSDIIIAFPKLSIINMQLVNTLFEYSNSRDLNEKKAILDLLQDFISNNIERIPQIIKMLNTRLQLIYNHQANPTATSNYLNVLYFILSRYRKYFQDPLTMKLLKSTVMPLIKLAEIPLFNMSYSKLIGFLCAEFPDLRDYQITLMKKYYPKISGKHTIYFVQVYGSIIKFTPNDMFETVYYQIYPFLMKIINGNFAPAVEMLLDQIEEIFTKEMMEIHGDLCIKTLYNPIQHISTSFFQGSIKEKAGKLLMTLFDSFPKSHILSLVGKNENPIKIKIHENDRQKLESWNKIIQMAANTEMNNSIETKMHEVSILFSQKK